MSWLYILFFTFSGITLSSFCFDALSAHDCNWVRQSAQVRQEQGLAGGLGGGHGQFTVFAYQICCILLNRIGSKASKCLST